MLYIAGINSHSISKDLVMKREQHKDKTAVSKVKHIASQGFSDKLDVASEYCAIDRGRH